jgi:hypothetical protein
MEIIMEHKIVYNNSYGGFSISLEAVNWLEANCKDNELRNFIKSLRFAGKEYSFASKDECLCYDVSSWFCDKRHHPDLVAVVEALGKDANGACANLAVEKISGNQYRIDKYDGAEDVITPNGNDWVFIND